MGVSIGSILQQACPLYRGGMTDYEHGMLSSWGGKLPNVQWSQFCEHSKKRGRSSLFDLRPGEMTYGHIMGQRHG
jgi:hypothetical protein